FLQDADAVAYIRFLSVYHDFDSVDRFIEEIQQLPTKPGESHPSPPKGAGRAPSEPDEPSN
ncbi:MAG: hypothetical protein WCY60_05220, partial [Trueperaceae bacterium]